jgi:hypothetical protein
VRTIFTCLGLVVTAAGSAAAPANLVPAGDTYLWTRGAKCWVEEVSPSKPVTISPATALVVEWRNPREVQEVRLRSRDLLPAGEGVRIEWWYRIWPDNGTGGWMRLDDPFNGEWVTAQTQVQAKGDECRITFRPLGTNEVSGIKRTGFVERQTYKVRITTPVPGVIEELRIYSDATLKQATLRFEFGCRRRDKEGGPRFEAVNSRILAKSFPTRNVARVSVEFAGSTNRLSADRGYVICRRGETNSFSVFVDDVVREGGIYVRDVDAFVSDAAKPWSFTTWPGATGEIWREGTIIEEVGRMPEQSFEQVMRAIPRKPVPEMFLGAPNLRQEFALGPRGEIILYADSLRAPGPDLDRRPWSERELIFQFGNGEDPGFWGNDKREVTRTLEEGWLPSVTHEWRSGDLLYRQRSVAAPLLQSIANLNSETGTEPLVLANEIEISNASNERRTASLWIALNHPEGLRLQEGTVLSPSAASDSRDHPGLKAVRAVLHPGGKGKLELCPVVPGMGATNVIRYEIQLGPNESHAIEVAMPYIELLDNRELKALKEVRYSVVHEQVVRFWKERVTRGMTYDVPDKFLNEFFKANFWHVLISTDIDPFTLQHQHGAATHHYRNYANETVMVARSLEMRGEHAVAEKLIEPFLANQGVKGLPGNFKSREGVLYAAHPAEPDPYTAQGYNMHHGWCLLGGAQHFMWTKDEVWLKKNADKLVKACDWIIRERQATRLKNPDGSRPLEYGLAPAGDLEDVEEYLHYYATDAYYFAGLAEAAEVLTQVRHPAASRLRRQAEAFRSDIRTSVSRSVAASPVVKLKDGTWVPYVPPRPYAITHLKEGWIREALYAALTLIEAGIYDEHHPFTEWHLQDLEDNIFLSRESGYGVEDQRANFFNFGGFTLQPNLPDLPVVYLERDQVRNFLRGFYNTCWASLYPESMCFAEWVPDYGKGGGPLFKTPDECKFVQWMRDMLVLEHAGALELGLGIPRAWMRHGQRVAVHRAATFFGQVDLEIHSRASADEIHADVGLTKTGAPRAVSLRLRHPDGKPIASATVNGLPARVNPVRQLIELPQSRSMWKVTARF